jgi:RimJ/RimL family protein N-acetyltransferase
MLPHFTLKEVKIVLEEEGCQWGEPDRFRFLSKNLEERHIYCQLYSSREWEGPKAPPVREGLLWITDCVKFAVRLAAAGGYYVVYLHEGNREEDFPHARFGIEDPEEVEAEFLETSYRRYAGIPWDILETKRCLIRETCVEDVDAFYRIYQDPSIAARMESLLPKVEEEKAYVREYIENVYAFYGFGVWTVLSLETGEIIGRAGFSYRSGIPEPLLCFVIAVPWQRQGLGEEVCRAIIAYGWKELEFKTIVAFVEPLNAPSLRLCCKLGFVMKGMEKIKGIKYMRMELSSLPNSL